MRTAVDTNVVSALLSGTAKARSAALAALQRAQDMGELCIAPVVYAELVAMPGRDSAVLEAFLKDADLVTDWTLTPSIWRSAALAFRGYAERRRAQRGREDPGPRRTLADFVIGAHAQEQADALLTFDRGLYKTAFPSLKLQGLP